MERAANGFRAFARHAFLGMVALGGGWLASVASAGINELTSLGPEGGHVADVAFHRTSPNIVYMAAAPGFFRSSDGGVSWQLTKPVPSLNGAADDVAVDPTQSDRVYVATGTNILVSQDRGLTFTTASLQGQQNSVWRVECGADGVAYVPDGVKMYRSNDHGLTWQVAGTFPQTSELAYSVVVDPADSRTVYVSLWTRGIFVSRDSGATWQQLGSEPALARTMRLEIDRNNPSRIWAGTDNGLYRSDNGGADWTATSLTGYVDAVEVDPYNSMTIYAGPQRRSTDGGATWDPVPQNFGAHLGRSRVAFHPTEAGRLIAFADGIWLSSDSGNHWTRGNTGLIATSVQRIVPAPTSSSLYLATRNGVHRLDGDRTVRPVSNAELIPADPNSASVIDLVASGNGGTDTLVAIVGGLRLARSMDSGSHWTIVPLPANNVVPIALAVSPGPQPTLFLGTWQGLFTSTDFGDTWTPRDVGLPMVDHIVTTSDAQIVYATAAPVSASGEAGSTRIFRSSDGGQNWSSLNLGESVVGLAVHPTDPRIVIAGVGNDLFRTTDGGTTWLRASADVETYYSIAFDRNEPSVVYAAGSGRVVRSTDGGRNWHRLIVVQNFYASPLSVVADPNEINSVLVATLGRGLQQVSIRPDLQVTVTGPGVIVTNAVMAFTVQLENRSGVPAHDARVTIQLPANVASVTATTAAGVCAVSGQQAVCTINVLGGGEIASIALNATTASEGTFSVQAAGTAADADSNAANNSATAQVTVSPPPRSGGGGGSASLLMLLALAALLIANAGYNNRGQTFG
jgi:photosystem II stability/assembly factor-like uncharacterized protein